MSIWAIADLHLNISIPEKTMEVFSDVWKDYVQKIQKNWTALIQEDDLVLIAGDICWAATLDQAIHDLMWIDALPGKKLLLKGNHDFWWGSLKKLQAILPSSIHVLQNTAFHFNKVGIGGSRLWDTEEYSFKDLIQYTELPNKLDKEEEIQKEFREKIYERELSRLEMSLSKLDTEAKFRIVMTHYPPISHDLQASRVSKLLEKYKINTCVFGHLHNLKETTPFFGEKNGIKYIFVAADFINFTPVKIFSEEQV